MANLEEQQRKMGQVIARTWLDEAFKARLKKNPVAVLKEVGYELPPGLEIEVVESTEKKAYLVLPPKPSGELSDDDLENIAGGAKSCLSQCQGCAPGGSVA